MPEPSLHALVCDLLGADPTASNPPRPTLAEARRRCRRGQLMPCRQGRLDLVLAVLPDGRAVVAPDRCPHDGGPLSDGFLDGQRLVCARHGWEFDLTTGACPGRTRVRLDVQQA